MDEMLNTVTEGFTTAKTLMDGGLSTARTAMDTGFVTARDVARTGLSTAKGAAITGFNTARGAVDTGITTAKENVFNFFNGDQITTRKKLLTYGAIVFMLGIIIGFLFAPIKKGFYFNISNNGNGTDNEDEDFKMLING